MKEKNVRFFSFISSYIMHNKVYLYSKAFGLVHTLIVTNYEGHCCAEGDDSL